MQMYDSVSQCDVTKSRMKCQTTDEAFQGQYNLWQKGASVGADFELLNFQNLLHAQNLYKTLKEMNDQ